MNISLKSQQNNRTKWKNTVKENKKETKRSVSVRRNRSHALNASDL